MKIRRTELNNLHAFKEDYTSVLAWFEPLTCRRWLQTVGEDRYTPKIDM